jgi:methyl-accepting chemotaxis protein
MQTERLLPEEVADDESAEGLRKQRDFYKHLFETVVETLPDPVGVVDADGIVTGWNENLGDLTGIPGEEAYGRQAYDVVGTEGQDEVLSEKVARLGEKIVEDEPRVGETAEGGIWAVQAKGVPLTHPDDGSTLGAFQVNTVVTDIVKRNRKLSDVKDRITDEVATATERLHTSLTETAENTEAITEATTEQAHDIDDIRAELAEVSGEAEEVAQRAQRIDEYCRDMQEAVSQSEEVVAAVTDSIEEAADVGANVEELATELETQAAEITKVTETIDDIAEQTNLLALNANIEAARAGMNGAGSGGNANHGFEVVADEVKALATQSQDEVTKVRKRVQAIQGNIEETVEGISQLQAELDDAVVDTHSLEETQNDITGHVRKVTEEMTAVANSVETQSAKIQTLQSEVETFAERTATVSDNITEIAAATAEQTETVADLDNTVQSLAADLEDQEL